MPLVLADRVRETTTTTGTGTVTLAGAVTGFQSFAAIGNGNTTYYTIAGQGTNEWEVGIGTYTASGTTLSRDTVLSSSAGAPNKTTFSAGTKDVFVTYPSERSVYSDGTNIVPDNAAVLLPSSGGTGRSTLTANNVLLGNGTTAVNFVAPGANGNVLTSNGTTWTSGSAPGFAAGTAMMFVQTAAPTGWTKSTTHDNKALRVVSGTASSGGSVAFTSAFASQTPSGSVSVGVSSGTLSVSAGNLAAGIGNLAAGNTTLTTTQIPSHTHGVRWNAGNGPFQGLQVTSLNNGVNDTNFPSGATGGGGSHNHSLTGNPSISGAPTLSGSPSITSASFTGTAINLAVQYVDVIIATKD